MKNIAIFISGSGSDMQSVIDACESNQINGKVVCVVSNKSNIYGLERAKKHNIPLGIFPLNSYANATDRDNAIMEFLEKYQVDLVVLAGYLSIVTPALVQKYRGVMINIHPSLIPKHCGMGMYGLKVHASVIQAKEKFSGATVHYVDEGADTGDIIRQVVVEVMDNDTPETLQARVLEAEHILLPQVVAMLCKD